MCMVCCGVPGSCVISQCFFCVTNCKKEEGKKGKKKRKENYFGNGGNIENWTWKHDSHVQNSKEFIIYLVGNKRLIYFSDIWLVLLLITMIRPLNCWWTGHNWKQRQERNHWQLRWVQNHIGKDCDLIPLGVCSWDWGSLNCSCFSFDLLLNAPVCCCE